MPVFNPKAEQPVYETIKGTFPFEIVGVEHLTSSGAKTAGCPERKVTLKFFKDTTFKEPLAQFSDSLYDHPDLLWKWSVFAKAAGVALAPGENFDIDDGWKGFRGFAECEPEANPKGKDPKKLWNKVKRYITDQPALLPNKAEDPFAE